MKTDKQPTQYYSKLWSIWKPILTSDNISKLKKYKYKLR